MSHQTLRRPKPAASSPKRKAGDEVLPGYRLLERIGRGGFGEVWKCEAPGGLLKAAKFVQRDHQALHASGGAEEELSALQRIRAIRHPFLLSIERIECAGDDLVIITELADQSLHARARERREAGHEGIPRVELLGYLHEAAEALDVLNMRHSLLHLDVKPQNLLLVSGHVKLGDFGMVHGLEAASGDGLWQRKAVTPLYAAPEISQGAIARSSDQYSLAIVYQELLTGALPFDGANARQLMMQHAQGEPDLTSLPATDRSAVARALSKDPAARFPSCAAFVQSLAETKSEEWARALALVVRDGSTSFDGTSLTATIRSYLAEGLLRPRLIGFCRRWQGHVLSQADRSFVFNIKTPRSFWQRWLGRRPGLEIGIHLGDAAGAESDGVEMRVVVAPHDLGRIQGREALEVIGLLLVEGLRNHLQAAPRRRGQERIVWPHEFDARPVFIDGRVIGQAIRCRGTDISMSGIGFLAPRELPTTHLHLNLPLTAETPAVEASARVVRGKQREDGWWDVGALLLAPVGREGACG